MAETTEMGRVTTPATVHSTSDERDVEFEDSRINVAAREDVPPDGGYGWICTGCVFVINAHTWGVNSVGLPILTLRTSH